MSAMCTTERGFGSNAFRLTRENVENVENTLIQPKLLFVKDFFFFLTNYQVKLLTENSKKLPHKMKYFEILCS